MFDINDKELIMNLIERKSKYVMPLYIRIYNEIYSLLELNELPIFYPNNIKIGFGCKQSMFDKYSLPEDKILLFDPVKLFVEYNEELSTNERYIIFESHYVDDDDELSNDINTYVNMLLDYIVPLNTEKRNDTINKVKEDNNMI